MIRDNFRYKNDEIKVWKSMVIWTVLLRVLGKICAEVYKKKGDKLLWNFSYLSCFRSLMLCELIVVVTTGSHSGWAVYIGGWACLRSLVVINFCDTS